jgi:hypothetical protein
MDNHVWMLKSEADQGWRSYVETPITIIRDPSSNFPKTFHGKSKTYRKIVSNGKEYKVTHGMGMRASDFLLILTITRQGVHYMYDREANDMIPYDREDQNKIEYGTIQNGTVKRINIQLPIPLRFKYNSDTWSDAGEQFRKDQIVSGNHKFQINAQDGTCVINDVVYRPIVNMDVGDVHYFLSTDSSHTYYFDHSLTPHQDNIHIE